MTKLPEPAILLPEGKWRFEVVGPVNGTINHCPVYTEAQMLQFRRDALEESIQCYSPDDTAADWTDKIRKLKDET
jgi:hypothetical protein